MSLTATEKIMARAGRTDRVRPGDVIECRVDLTWIHETQIAIFMEAFNQIGGNIFDREKVKPLIDHFITPRSEPEARAERMVFQFASRFGLDVLNEGIKHQVFREKRLALPGIVMVGPDSHTNTSGALGAFASTLGPTETAVVFNHGKIWFKVPETIRVYLEGGPLASNINARDLGLTIFQVMDRKSQIHAQYKSIEITGPALKYLSISDRMVLANMSSELGAKNCIVEPDEKIEAHVRDVDEDRYWILKSDQDANFFDQININLDSIREPLISLPDTPTNVGRVKDVAGTTLDQVFIGGCTNGNIEDLRLVADILKNNKVHQGLRLLITPATRRISLRALEEGLIDVFFKAGALIGSPGCSACPGYEGVLADDQVCLATSSRNFLGRMGSNQSKIYLSSPVVAAASALAGEIIVPNIL